MQLLDRLRALYPWEPIRDCPGRYVVPRGLASHVPPECLLEQIQGAGGALLRTRRFVREEGKDAVFVAVFDDDDKGGLITFCKPNGTEFVHTLNEPEGLARKLRGLGLEM